jgi:hypothetical protein
MKRVAPVCTCIPNGRASLRRRHHDRHHHDDAGMSAIHRAARSVAGRLRVGRPGRRLRGRGGRVWGRAGRKHHHLRLLLLLLLLLVLRVLVLRVRVLRVRVLHLLLRLLLRLLRLLLMGDLGVECGVRQYHPRPGPRSVELRRGSHTTGRAAAGDHGRA